MALLTQFMTFFVSPFSEPASHAELNNFLKAHRIINKVLIERIIKDKKCLHLLYEIIDSFDGGLPIGNLTSQFFANYYLSPLDHFVLEQLKVGGYVRYMDDIIVFSNEDVASRLRNIQLTILWPHRARLWSPAVKRSKATVWERRNGA